MSYTISGEGNGLNYSILRQLLKDQTKNSGNEIFGNSISWVEKPVSEKVNVAFGSFGGFANKKSNHLNLDPRFYKQHASIKNVLDGHSGFVNKMDLYQTIKKLIPLGIKYLPITYTILEVNNIFKDGNIKYPAIIKKNYSSKQEGVRVIESKEDYFRAKKELDIQEDGLVSEYITNPLTIEGRKFHFRVYYLLSAISGIIKCSSHNIFKIRTAKLPYKKGDWLNPDIHITGGQTTGMRYIYPNGLNKMDFNNKLDSNKTKLLENMDNFNKVVCLALASSGVKNYPESNAGYQVYGADVLITEDLTPYLIEINKHPGFTRYGDKNGWDEYINNFSTHFFYFILKNTVFPYLGLCKPPIPMATFISNGVLSPFGEILTKYTLIPITNATANEIIIAQKINFYNIISFDTIQTECYSINIFLISRGFSPLTPREFSPLTPRETQNDKTLSLIKKENLINKEDSHVIGFIAITHDLYIKIAILKEYQNRGIATAMIAQLMEIQYARHYTDAHIPILKIKEKNGFLSQIARKLHFTLNKENREYERKCKINIVFMLMDILAAYYAPTIPQLIIPIDFEYIEFELQFTRGTPFEANKKEYFHKKCR